MTLPALLAKSLVSGRKNRFRTNGGSRRTEVILIQPLHATIFQLNFVLSQQQYSLLHYILQHTLIWMYTELDVNQRRD